MNGRTARTWSWPRRTAATRRREVRRLEALGATVVAVGEGGLDLVIMEDPEGNGFSVVGPRG
jgi:hypothetical protein